MQDKSMGRKMCKRAARSRRGKFFRDMAAAFNKGVAALTIAAVIGQFGGSIALAATEEADDMTVKEAGIGDLLGSLLGKGSISGYKYNDENEDGDISEQTPLQGWTIELTGGLLGFKRSATTDATGYYEFKNLFPGTYQVSEKSPGSDLYKQTYPVDPENSLQPANYFVSLTRSSKNYTDINFGNYLPKCGNGYIDVWSGEDCEGSLFNSCDAGGTEGVETCDASTCEWGACEPVVCGDNSVTGNERCDNETRACVFDGYNGTQACNGICDGWNACDTTE